MFKESTMREVIDELFREAGFLPDILLKAPANHTLHTMVKNNLCCTILPEIYAVEDDKVAYFRLPSRPVWEICAVYKKGSYLTKAGKDFINMASLFWNSPEGSHC